MIASISLRDLEVAVADDFAAHNPAQGICSVYVPKSNGEIRTGHDVTATLGVFPLLEIVRYPLTGSVPVRFMSGQRFGDFPAGINESDVVNTLFLCFSFEKAVWAYSIISPPTVVTPVVTVGDYRDAGFPIVFYFVVLEQLKMGVCGA